MSRTTPWQNLVAVSDVTNDDSDKMFAVPAGKQWVLQWIYVTLACSATVGNRAIWINIMDAANNVIYKLYGGAVVTATNSGLFSFAPGNPDETSFTSTYIRRSLPFPFALPGGYKIQVHDLAAVDATHDDMTVRMLVEERSE